MNNARRNENVQKKELKNQRVLADLRDVQILTDDQMKKCIGGSFWSWLYKHGGHGDHGHSSPAC